MSKILGSTLPVSRRISLNASWYLLFIEIIAAVVNSLVDEMVNALPTVASPFSRVARKLKAEVPVKKSNNSLSSHYAIRLF